MFGFEKSIIICRTPHEVFEFVANPSNIPLWRYDVLEIKFDSLPIKAGDKITEIIGSKDIMTSLVDVIAIQPDHRLLMKVTSGPMNLPIRELIFEEEGEHTKLTARISAHTDGISRFIQPLSATMYSIKWETYLFTLKRVLETI